MKRTISVMVGKGSVNHNSRKFHAKNTDPERCYLNIQYCNDDIKDVYHELFDEALERYNAKQTRKDRRIDDYYEKTLSGKQEQPFHEIIIQIGNRDDMGATTEDGELAKKVLDEYMQGFQKRNPMLKVFSAHLHMDEATPHLHIDFVPFITGSKRGLDTRVSLKQALGAMGHKGGTRSDTELNQWVTSEKEALANVMGKYDIEWEQKETHEKHLSLLNFEKQERAKEVAKLEEEKVGLEERNSMLAEHTEKLFDQLEEIEADVHQAKEMRENADKEAEKAKKAAEKYEKHYNKIVSLSRDVKRYAGEFSKSSEEVLPEADFLESGRGYRENKALPVMRKLKDLLYGLYLAYLEIQRKLENIEYRYSRLESSNASLVRRNQELDYYIDKISEDVNDYQRLRRCIGEKMADGIVKAEQEREIAEMNAKKMLRRKHDRDAR